MTKKKENRMKDNIQCYTNNKETLKERRRIFPKLNISLFRMNRDKKKKTDFQIIYTFWKIIFSYLSHFILILSLQ